MPTLRDVLIALRRLDVEPSEISIPQDVYVYIVQQANELVYEEEVAGEQMEQDDQFFMK